MRYPRPMSEAARPRTAGIPEVRTEPVAVVMVLTNPAVVEASM